MQTSGANIQPAIQLAVRDFYNQVVTSENDVASVSPSFIASFQARCYSGCLQL